jgi:RNA polymerase sigma factor (sigma-70 family)
VRRQQAAGGPADRPAPPAIERDLDLIARWQQGDTAAGVELMDHYAGLVRLVARRCGVRGDRDLLDLWQDLLVRVLQHLPDLEQRVHSSFAGYLAWQARDLAAKFRQRRPAAVQAAEPVALPADPAERSEFWQAVLLCEQALPPGEQRVFALRFREGLGLGEVADRTGSNANAVAQSVFRLVRRMRACLQGRGFGLPGGDAWNDT